MKRVVFVVGLGTLAALPVGAQGPTLVPAVLRSVAPAGFVRGREVTLTLSGVNLAGATRAIFDHPGITGTPAAGANRNQVVVRATIAPDVPPGIHRVFLLTPNGTTGTVTFAVGAWPEVPEREPDADAGAAPLAKLPATLVGALAQAGDVDRFRFEVAEGEELVFEVVASQVRSRLQSALAIRDADGKVVAESEITPGQPDALLGHRFAKAGTYTLEIRDLENAAGGDVTYRINAGRFPLATSVFPLGVPKEGGEVSITGYNLAAETLRVTGSPGTATLTDTAAGRLHVPLRVAVGEELEVLGAGRNHDGKSAQAVEWPVTINGRLDGREGEGADYYRFHARKGETLALEVNARRLGSPLDPVLEVLDGSGRRIERATLRCLSETYTVLRDHESATGGIRLFSWNDLAVNDLIYLRGEVAQIVALPRGPDDDTRFRVVRGQRVGLLETTPVAHAINTPAYKVRVYPPGTPFPPNGMPLFHLYYRNDDGGPLYGKDSKLTFTAPADGDYVVRIADVRGERSPRHAYRLTIRKPRPDFRLALANDHPSVPAGSSVPVDVTVERVDGFDGEIEVSLEGLPAGITAAPTVVDAGENSATLLLTAAADAKSAEATLRVVGRARTGDAELVRNARPGGGTSYLTVLPAADLQVRTAEERVRLLPGKEVKIEARISREHGFAGRVPVEVKNLPFGVRVLDVGLNGVLITESETARRFTLVAEPWVKPMQRWIYCTVRTETESSASTEVSTPLLLEIGPADPQKP